MKLMTILVTILLAVGTATAAPTVFFNTFGPADMYDTIAAEIGTSVNRWDQADKFMTGSATAYSLDKIELAAVLFSGTNALDVRLMSDAAGEPGTILEAFNFTGQMSPEPGSILSGVSVLHPVLYPGTPYWLVTSAPAADTDAGWNYSFPNVYGTHAYRSNLGPWTINPEGQLGAFRISGSPISPVPVPGALLLGSIGVGVVSWLRKHRTL